MSSKQITERSGIDLLQTEYRQSWQRFTIAVELLQSTTKNDSSDAESVTNARARCDEAAVQYRDARNALADRLLQEDADREEEQHASRSDRPVARYQAA